MSAPVCRLVVWALCAAFVADVYYLLALAIQAAYRPL